MAHLLASWGYETLTARDGRDALEKLADFDADTIITTSTCPTSTERGLLAELQKSAAAPPVIVLTAYGSVEKAVEIVRELGAFWYLEKPAQPRYLHTSWSARWRSRSSPRTRSGWNGNSPPAENWAVWSRSLRRCGWFSPMLEQAAPTKATILIGGETGTGKEVASRAIHDLSPRRAGPFLAMNCARIAGHADRERDCSATKSGAFTGAAERRAGYFELANGGTLLLDEIGEMPISTQAKLLRVLEERKIRRLGGTEEIEVDVRIVAATNRDLREGIAKGTFREDLYFRLNVFEVQLPPLRERREDILLIARALLDGLNKRHECRVTDLAPDVEALFSEYPWPGNVRELRNVLERAVILAGEGVIRRDHLPPGFAGLPNHLVETPSGEVTLRPGVTVEEAERQLILMTLKHTDGNRARAAELLGLSVKTLFNKLKQYNEPEPMRLRARLLVLSVSTVAVIVTALFVLHLNSLTGTWLDIRRGEEQSRGRKADPVGDRTAR